MGGGGGGGGDGGGGSASAAASTTMLCCNTLPSAAGLSLRLARLRGEALVAGGSAADCASRKVAPGAAEKGISMAPGTGTAGCVGGSSGGDVGGGGGGGGGGEDIAPWRTGANWCCT